MTTQARRDRLFQFFGAYFSEDWTFEADTPDGILSAYVRGRDPRQLEALSQDIAAYVQEHPDDGELEEKLFKELGCYVSPKAAGLSARSWMLDVAKKLSRPG